MFRSRLPRHIIAFNLIVVLILLSNCRRERHEVVNPKYSGIIVDSKTKAPISDIGAGPAVVTLKPDEELVQVAVWSKLVIESSAKTKDSVAVTFRFVATFYLTGDVQELYNQFRNQHNEKYFEPMMRDATRQLIGMINKSVITFDDFHKHLEAKISDKLNVYAHLERIEELEVFVEGTKEPVLNLTPAPLLKERGRQ